MSDSTFNEKYKQFNHFINKIKNLKQIKEGHKLLKEMENELETSDSSRDKNEMKKKINECKFKLNDTIEEIKIMQDRSKLDITFNESSMSKLNNNVENNPFCALNSKKKMNQLKEEMGLQNDNKSPSKLQFNIKNPSKEETEKTQVNNSVKSRKFTIMIIIIVIIIIIITIFIFFKLYL